MYINTKSYDVIVVGAGPSGLNTAKGLAEYGFKVCVFESKQDAGVDVICSGVVGVELFDKFDISPNSIIREVSTARLISPYGNSIDYSYGKPFANIIERSVFDKELKQKAMSKGAEIYFRRYVSDLYIEQDSVQVFIKKEDNSIEEYRAKVVVLATGVNTALSKKAELGYPVRFTKAIQQVVEIQDVHPLTIFVGNEISDSAFAWLIPTYPGKYKIGLMAEDNCITRFKKFMAKYFPEIKYAKPQVKPIVQGAVPRSFAHRAIVVGEAAGQVKTTTGGGIYWGLLCSEIACDVIKGAFKKNKFDAETLSLYERRWKDLILSEINTGFIVKKLCSYLNDNQIEHIIQVLKSDGLIDFIRKNAVFDWHGKALFNLLRMDSLKEVFRD